MKLLIFLTFISINSWALPILNRNEAPSESRLIVWPDHKDSNTYYIAPNAYKLNPDFKYQEFGEGKNRIGVLWAPFSQWFDQEKLDQLKAARPQGKFEKVPLSFSAVKIGKALEDFVKDFECKLHTEAIDFDFYCVIVFNQLGIKKVIPYLQSGKTLALNGEFRIDGIIERVDQRHEELAMLLGLPVIVGLSESSQF